MIYFNFFIRLLRSQKKIPVLHWCSVLQALIFFYHINKSKFFFLLQELIQFNLKFKLYNRFN